MGSIKVITKRIDIKKAQKKAELHTKVYTPQELINLIVQIPQKAEEVETEFVVNDLTTLDSARKEYLTQEKLVYLNFASARNPDGGFLNGSQAQEESIAVFDKVVFSIYSKGERFITSFRKEFG